MLGYVARLRIAFIAGFLLSSAASAFAQHVIAGVPVSCVDFRGIPVVLLPNPALQDVGMASVLPNGAPVMYLNPNVLNNLPPHMQLFWYAHECGHHALGHIVNRSLLNESEADCWAVKTGRNQGWFPPQAFQLLVQMLGNSPGSMWGHLPGPQRIQNMFGCYNTP